MLAYVAPRPSAMEGAINHIVRFDKNLAATVTCFDIVLPFTSSRLRYVVFELFHIYRLNFRHFIPVNLSLTAEMGELVRFKSSALTDIGFHLSGVWNEETILQKLEHLGLMFGAMRAAPSGIVAGLGIPARHLTIAMLVFARLWDWYVQWREVRRGFFTRWEVDMLRLASALTRKQIGWLR